MSSDTIIIECNRQIAYKQELDTLGNSFSPDGYEPPNNKWKTHISNGIPVNVGDQISVEATMINTKGAPDETIEFLGDKNSLNTQNFVDNECQVDFNYYITNRRQFNFNMPLESAYTSQTETAVDYGFPDVSTYADFLKNYPTNGIEGFVYTPATSAAEGEYTATKVPNYVASNPPKRLLNTSPKRLYYVKNFLPYGWDGTSDGVQPEAGFGTVDLEIPTGFNTPSAVANTLTSQLQERTGDATNFTEIDAAPTIFTTHPTVPLGLKAYNHIGQTTETYITIPTATGYLPYARKRGEWAATFTGETGANSAPGLGYEPRQGFRAMWNNLLVANYKQFIARGTAWNELMSRAAPASSITDFIQADAAGIIHWNGSGYSVMLTDTMDGEKGWSPTILADNKRADADITLTDPFDLHLQEGTVIPTNIMYNYTNLILLKNILQSTERYPEDIPEATLQNAQDKYWQTDLGFGVSDDVNSMGSRTQYGGRVNMPYPGLNPGGNGQPQYATVDGKIRYMTAKVCPYRESNNIKQNHCYVMTRFDNDTFDTAQLSPLTRFRFTNSKGYRPKYLDGESANLNVGIIPVFFTEAWKPDPNYDIDVPVCAFVHIPKAVEYRTQCLLPAVNEYISIASPFFYDNEIAKPITTQKIGNGFFGGTSTTDSEYPTRTDTLDYMPFIFIGADSPQVSFNKTGDGKFSINTLHTQLRAGNSTFQRIPQKTNPNAGQISMEALGRVSAYAGLNSAGAIVNPLEFVQDTDPYPYISSQSGVAIVRLSVRRKNTSIKYPLSDNQPEPFKNTLFSKLGFIIEQLLPFVGGIQTQFNRSNYNRFLGVDTSLVKKKLNMVKPFTTDAYQSAFTNIGAATNNNNEPMENLGVIGFGDETDEVKLDAESDELIANNLPSKLDFAYLIVYSDIVQNTQFYGGASGSQKIPAMAYISRNYSEGDYFYSFTTNWNYTADKPYILTDINTTITLPNGEPAPIEPNSSVIYKITKPKALPPPPLPVKEENGKRGTHAGDPDKHKK